MKQEEVIAERVANREGARVMGLHVRRFGGYSRQKKGVTNMSLNIDRTIQEELRQPEKMRRALSICHVSHLAKAEVNKEIVRL